jgi:hypothetical protein
MIPCWGFISPDTINAEPTTPQALNLYSYVNNDLLNYTDPSRHYRRIIDLCIDNQIFGRLVRYTWGMAREPKQEPIDWRDGRPQRAWELHQQDWKQTIMTAAVGMLPRAFSQWAHRGRAGGLTALPRHTAPRSAPQPTVEQRADLGTALAKGAPALGLLARFGRLNVVLRSSRNVSPCRPIRPITAGACGRSVSVCAVR